MGCSRERVWMKWCENIHGKQLIPPEKIQKKRSHIWHDSWMEICWVWTEYINLFQITPALKIYYPSLPPVLYLTIQWFAWESGASWQWIYELQSIHTWGSGTYEHVWRPMGMVKGGHKYRSQERIHPTRERKDLAQWARLHSRAWGSYGKSVSRKSALFLYMKPVRINHLSRVYAS